jgi:UPF0716 protein FxsA
MRPALFVVFFVLLEITSFILMADWIGLSRTLLLVVLSIGIGWIILRKLGKQISMVHIRLLREGQLKTQSNTSKPYLVLVAILLMIPGFLSDLLALLVWIPQVRAFIAKKIQSKVNGFRSTAANDGHRIIEGECEKINKIELPRE